MSTILIKTALSALVILRAIEDCGAPMVPGVVKESEEASGACVAGAACAPDSTLHQGALTVATIKACMADRPQHVSCDLWSIYEQLVGERIVQALQGNFGLRDATLEVALAVYKDCEQLPEEDCQAVCCDARKDFEAFKRQADQHAWAQGALIEVLAESHCGENLSVAPSSVKALRQYKSSVKQKLLDNSIPSSSDSFASSWCKEMTSEEKADAKQSVFCVRTIERDGLLMLERGRYQWWLAYAQAKAEDVKREHEEAELDQAALTRVLVSVQTKVSREALIDAIKTRKADSLVLNLACNMYDRLVKASGDKREQYLTLNGQKAVGSQNRKGRSSAH